MSDRTMATPFLVAPSGRAPSAGGSWSLPAKRPAPQQARSVLTAIARAWRRQRTRAALAQLDEHLLKDIGVTYAEAENEANKPFWQA
jgi:uncharacterized protein YjiS (DUF1127 family)